MNRLLILPVLLFSLLVGTPAFSTDYQKDLTPYRSGDYATSLFTLMFDNGQDFPQDYKTAMKWPRLGAEQGHAYYAVDKRVM